MHFRCSFTPFLDEPRLTLGVHLKTSHFRPGDRDLFRIVLDGTPPRPSIHPALCAWISGLASREAPPSPLDEPLRTDSASCQTCPSVDAGRVTMEC